MTIVVVIVLLLAAHFSLTAFVPSPAGQAQFYWPWAAEMHPVVGGIGALPQGGGGIITPALAGIAGLCLLAAAAALLNIAVPADWWLPLVIVGALASTVLFVLYLSPLSLIPIALNLFLLWGAVVQHWTVAGLRG